MKLSDKEVAAILAGLRMLQAEVPENERKNLIQFLDCDPTASLSNGITDAEIDDLCERINLKY